jgi:acyl carrier protein
MEEQIIKVLESIRPEFDFNNSSNFIDEGLLDSFDLISLVAALESEFDILIEGIDIVPENFNSIDAIGNLIKCQKGL